MGEKDIPEEGNARRPDLHQTRINDFHGSGRKNKNIIKDQVFVMASGKKLKSDNSLEMRPKFKAHGSDFKYRYRPQSKENMSLKKKQIVEQQNSDSKWSLWSTLKNPLQWLGIATETNNTPTKAYEYSQAGRHRSISHHTKYIPAQRVVRVVPSQRGNL